jgi:hypothetical protein
MLLRNRGRWTDARSGQRDRLPHDVGPDAFSCVSHRYCCSQSRRLARRTMRENGINVSTMHKQ